MKVQQQKLNILLILHNQEKDLCYVYTIIEATFSFSKHYEIKNYTLCLGNISKDCTVNKMKKAGLKGNVNFFSVDFNPFDTKDI